MKMNPNMFTNEEKHRLVWNELARTGGLFKSIVIDRLFGEEERKAMCEYASCYACKEAVVGSVLDGYYCDRCPITWGTGKCDSEDSPYELWCRSDRKERRAYAKQIAEMEWHVKKKKRSMR